MSQNKILFKINNHMLYNDVKLIDLDVPVLFVCIDESQNRYLVLCVDPDDCYYLVVPITSHKLIQMLNGQITMRNPFETSDVIYSIITAPDYINDDITEKSPKEIDDEDLPRDGAYFNLKLHDDLNSYISDLQNNFQTSDSLKLVLSDEWNIKEHYDASLKEYLIYYDLKFSTLGRQKFNKFFNIFSEGNSMYDDLFKADDDLNNMICCNESEDSNYTMSAA